MATTESPAAATSVLFVGVGGIGCELAAQCTASRSARRLLDFDAAALDAYDPAETIGLAGAAASTDDMDPDDMRAAAEAAADQVAATVGGGTELALLLGAVGGQTGAVVLPILANDLKSARSTVLVVALEPLPFEGAARAELAAQAMAELENVADLIISVPNRPLAELCDASLPVGEAIRELRARTLQAVDQLVGALTCGSSVGFQPSELRRSLAEAGRGALGVGVGTEGARVEAAIRDACANSFLTQESCQQASAAILHLRGGTDVSLQEVRSATDLVAQLVGRVPIQVGLSTDADDAETVRATLLVTGIRPPIAAMLCEGASVGVAQDQGLSFYDGVDLDVPAYLRRRPSPRLRH